MSSASLARSIEIYQYNNREITNEMVWPPDQLSSEGQIFSVNAGESSEYAIEFNASLTSVVQPTPQDWVGPTDMFSSVYSVMSNDGVRISADEWKKWGGSVQVILNKDTTSARLILRGPKGLITQASEEGEPKTAASFQIADFADGDNARRATLRILGTGVAFNKQKITIPTSVPDSRTETQVGTTIDNPYIGSVNEVYRAGVRAAKMYSGLLPELRADVISVNRRGDSGIATLFTYADVEVELKTTLGAAATYAMVENYYTSNNYNTYRQVEKFWKDKVANDFVNQVFGNVAGARVYDQQTRRYYRVRDVTITPDSVRISADDDLVYADAQKRYGTRKYSEVETIFTGKSYQQAQWAGLYG